MGSSSFGPIGAARFGGIYGSAASTAATGSSGNSMDLSAPLYGSLGDSLASASGGGTGSVPSVTASSRPSFLLSDLGGEILQPRRNDSASNAIGGQARNPFAFSGAFASLSAAESDSHNRLTASNAGGGVGPFEPSRTDVIGTPKGGSSLSSFRNDTEIFAPSSASGLGSSGVYGRPTLNANAPAFMASSSQEAAPFGSSSPSAWPTMNVKPRRAPPGLSKPTEISSPSLSGGKEGTSEGTPLPLPPGLMHPSHSAGFGGYAPSSASFFSGEGVRQFASKLKRPNFQSLSDTFRSSGPESSQEFTSSLSELNAKSMSVEEVQSNLKATALAAAHDVVSDAPIDQKTSRLSTPKKAAKTPRSPRRAVDFKSPSTSDEKRGEKSARGFTDPKSRTPTRRNESAASAAAVGVASPAPGTRGPGDRRGRHGKEPALSEAVGRNARSGQSESSSKVVGRRGRAGGQETTAQGVGTDPRHASRNAQSEAASTAVPVPTKHKKTPGSNSSVGSDDQMLTVSTLAEVTEENRGVQQHNLKGSPREPKPAGRNTSVKKSTASAQAQEKRVGTRQVYREKVVVPDTTKNEVAETKNPGDGLHGGSDADASSADSQTDDEVKAPSSEAEPMSVVDRNVQPTSTKAVDTPASAPNDTAPSETPTTPEIESTASKDQSLVTSAEQTECVEPTSAEPPLVHGESVAVPDSPLATVSPATVSHATASTPTQLESDSGSEFPEFSSRALKAGGASDRKTSAKEHKKDKHKKEKAEKKKTTAPTKSSKKEKRDSGSSGKGDLVDDDEPFNTSPAKKQSVSPVVKLSTWLRNGRILTKRSVVALWTGGWYLCSAFADRVNLKGFLSWSFSYLESFLAVVFSVILLLSLHGASFFIRLHRVAFRAVLTHRHVGFCFAFLYAFPFLVQYVFPWAPPWAPVCLWYAFLVQLFCTNGPAAMVATFRIVLPLMFLVEGISHHSFLLDLNGEIILPENDYLSLVPHVHVTLCRCRAVACLVHIVRDEDQQLVQPDFLAFACGAVSLSCVPRLGARRAMVPNDIGALLASCDGCDG
jgi:hypothetical protein